MAPFEEITHLADVVIDLQVELDRRKMTVKEILNLDTGQVVKMVRSAGENIDILVGNTLLGYGEIVIIEDAMGIRVTDFYVEE